MALEVAATEITLRIQFLHATIVDLFNALKPDATSWLLGADRARLLLLIGWRFVLFGATEICAAEMVTQRTSSSHDESLPRRIASAVALFATIIFLTSGIWSMISLNTLNGSLAATEVASTDIAEGVRGVMDAAFIDVIGICLCAIATLLMAIATY